MIAVWNVHRAGMPEQASKLMRIACGIVLRADGDQHGKADLTDFGLAEKLASASHASGKRLKVALGCFGKAAERPLHRIGDGGKRGRFHRRRKAEGESRAI